MSGKQVNAPQHDKLNVTNESVAIYGYVSTVVVSGLGASILHVQQHPSTCSHLNTELVPVSPFHVYGSVHSSPSVQRYMFIGRVL